MVPACCARRARDAIEVPIDAGDVGDVYVSITYLRDGRLYRAERRLGVPAAERTLQLTITADQAVSRPQEPGTFTVPRDRSHAARRCGRR